MPDRTVIRAGFGIYNELLDDLGYRMDQNAPFNPTYSIASLPVSGLPVDPASAPASNALLVPGGVQPDAKMPTLISYSLRVEQELTRNTSLTVGYVGSHGYHELIGVDGNEPVPTVCPSAPCPAAYPSTFPAPLAGAAIPAGSFYIPAGRPRATPTLANTWTWFAWGTANYNSLQVDLNHRFGHDLTVRGVYTWSKALDDGDSLNSTIAGNAPGTVSNAYDVKADWGPATFNVTNIGVASAVYALPFGHGKRFGSGMQGFANGVAGGWSVDSILTLQSGFPLTPQLSYNPSNNGDTRNPVRPFLNPTFYGSPVIGKSSQWFNPAAYLAPPANSGFYGNLGRDSLPGPGLATWDFAGQKDVPIHEALTLEFRGEIFNLLNRANFNLPNLIAFTPSGVSPTAGAITSTATSSRQVQFALKLLW